MKSGKYQHYKGRYYEVLGVAYHGETFEEMVVYRALFSGKYFGKKTLWVRSKKVFLEEVGFQGKIVPRFRFVN